MTAEQKARLIEINKQIQALQKERELINPFANLKALPNKALLSCVSTPNLPAWRLRKWLKEGYQKEFGDM